MSPMPFNLCDFMVGAYLNAVLAKNKKTFKNLIKEGAG